MQPKFFISPVRSASHNPPPESFPRPGVVFSFQYRLLIPDHDCRFLARYTPSSLPIFMIYPRMICISFIFSAGSRKWVSANVHLLRTMPPLEALVIFSFPCRFSDVFSTGRPSFFVSFPFTCFGAAPHTFKDCPPLLRFFLTNAPPSSILFLAVISLVLPSFLVLQLVPQDPPVTEPKRVYLVSVESFVRPGP